MKHLWISAIAISTLLTTSGVAPPSTREPDPGEVAAGAVLGGILGGSSKVLSCAASAGWNDFVGSATSGFMAVPSRSARARDGSARASSREAPGSATTASRVAPARVAPARGSPRRGRRRDGRAPRAQAEANRAGSGGAAQGRRPGRQPRSATGRSGSAGAAARAVRVDNKDRQGAHDAAQGQGEGQRLRQPAPAKGRPNGQCGPCRAARGRVRASDSGFRVSAPNGNNSDIAAPVSGVCGHIPSDRALHAYRLARS